MAKLADDIVIRLGGEDIVLRPSLRFAMRLERRPGSFGQLAREITDGSLTTACEIIRDHEPAMPYLKQRVFEALGELREPLMRYVLDCAGFDPDAPAADNDNPQTVTFAEHLAALYRVGTGWLGWTPQDTLGATPAEIMEARAGRLELLKAIFGEAEKPKEKASFTDDNVMAAMRSLGAVREAR
jgi:hypothetical protein